MLPGASEHKLARFFLPFLLLAGCADVRDALDTTPARVEVDAPAGAVLDASPRPMVARVLTKSGKLLPEAAAQLTWAVTPASVAEVAGGQLRCRSTGDANVLVTGASVSTAFTVQCRVVTAIDVPSGLVLLLGEPGAPLTLTARDATGAVLADVTPTVQTSSPDVFVVRGATADGRSVGTANLLVEAGAVREEVAVTVIERVTTDTLSLADGSALTYTLTRGKYRVEINVRADDGSGYGVTVSGVGAGCASQDEAMAHQLECVVADTASLVVTNPTSWGLGPSALGNLTIYRIP